MIFKGYTTLFSILFVLAPILTFGFVLSFFKNISAYKRYITHYNSDVFIFSELNEKSLALAKSLYKNDSKSRFFVFTDVFEKEEEQSYELVEKAKELGAVCFKKDIVTIDFSFHSKKSDLSFFAIGEDQSENISQALKIVEKLKYRDNTNLYVFSTQVEAEMLLAHAFNSADNDIKIKVRRVNEVQSLITRNLYENGYEKIFKSAYDDGSGIKKINPHDEIMHSSNDKEITKRILNKQTIKKHYISNPNLSNDELARTIGYGLSSKEISRIKTNVKKDFEVPGDLVNLNIYKEIPIIQAFSSGEIVVIGQPSSLFILSQSSTILFDGTFRVVGTGEMYIVHGIYKDVCICCLYARMLKRDQEHYIKLFNTIQHMGELRDINIFKRDIIVKSDFEYPVINAMNILYPDAHFSGCYFHLVYNIMKRIGEFGLYKLYKENVTFKQFVRRIRSICLLPLDYISSKTVNFLYEYNEIVLLEQYNINIKENKGYCDFKDYLDYTWFGFENGKCLFPPNMWCVKDIKIRTNNFCESSHKTINSDLKSGRIDIVQTFEAVKKNIERDQRKLSKTKCVYEKGVDLTITKTLISLRKQFDNNEIDIPNYLDLVSKLVQCKNHNELRTFNARNM